MTERYMRVDRAITVALWVLVFKIAAMTVVASMLGWIGDDTERLVLVVLFPTTGAAVAMQVKLYAVRMCSMIRATAGVDRGHGAQVRTLH